MHEIMKLKEMLCKELEKYGSKENMSPSELEIVDKLAHAVKNLAKIIEAAEEEEEEYSEHGGRGGNRYAYEGGRGGRYSMRYPEPYDMYSREGGGSYARGRGRNARRDSMGRYSREGYYSRTDGMEEMVQSIRDMMQELPPEVQQEAQRFVQKLEQQM